MAENKNTKNNILWTNFLHQSIIVLCILMFCHHCKPRIKSKGCKIRQLKIWIYNCVQTGHFWGHFGVNKTNQVPGIGLIVMFNYEILPQGQEIGLQNFLTQLAPLVGSWHCVIARLVTDVKFVRRFVKYAIFIWDKNLFKCESEEKTNLLSLILDSNLTFQKVNSWTK